ncbi:M24 family metallopeptidase [Arenibacterium sp. LLYu02]|uniref:M24 family metallopeptidase n=1 Tax=Arenibacterium sp. LLYu02 TaxID=3404132 RepID=UPI003B221CD5
MPTEPNIPAIRALPETLGLDAVVAMSPENFAYVSGAYIFTVALIRPRQAFAVIPARGAPFQVLCSLETSLSAEESWIDDIRSYTEFVDVPVKALAEALIAAGLTRGRIGLDMDYMPMASWEVLRHLMPEAEFVDSSAAVAGLRALKMPGEIALLRSASERTHRAVLDAMAASQPGDSELAMSNLIAKNMIDTGADGTLFMCFASGRRSHHTHGYAQADVVPQPGDIIRLDVAGTYGAFASDFARTYSAGAPSAAQREVYRGLIESQIATIAAMGPGVVAEDLFHLCREEFARRGLDFHMPHIGHSFGHELHESPMLRPGDKTRLRPGMVINVEPAVHDEENSRYHTEDLILITETGTELLSLGIAPLELPVIGTPI